MFKNQLLLLSSERTVWMGRLRLSPPHLSFDFQIQVLSNIIYFYQYIQTAYISIFQVLVPLYYHVTPFTKMNFVLWTNFCHCICNSFFLLLGYCQQEHREHRKNTVPVHGQRGWEQQRAQISGQTLNCAQYRGCLQQFQRKCSTLIEDCEVK